VVAVDRRRTDGFAVDGSDALAEFAGGLGDELLEPRAEVVDLRRSEKGDLVAACVVCGAEEESELDGRVGVDRELGLCRSLARFFKKFADMQAGEGGGDDPEVGERGITAPEGRVTI